MSWMETSITKIYLGQTRANYIVLTTTKDVQRKLKTDMLTEHLMVSH